MSLVPEVVKQLTQQQVTVWVEKDAGRAAFSDDGAYAEAGASIKSRQEILQQADVLLSIRPPEESDWQSVSAGKIWIGVFQPLFNSALMEQWAGKQFTVFSLDAIPRTTRAQSMDVLSSQANIAGYKAVLLAACTYSRYFPMFMTAAGSIPPAKVLILGAGVAGLQAIATARRLGAVVEVFDTRPAVKEEVMSLGARFVEVEGAADASAAGGYAVEQTDAYKAKQAAKIAESAIKADIVITTAQIPGKAAPILIPQDVVEKMRKGSVIIDLAAATGGNTAVTKNAETVLHQGVTVIGNSDLAGTVPADASRLYARNVLNFLKLIINKEGNIDLDFNDDIVKGACIAHAGNIMNKK